jgi:hypothetical protein
MSLNHIIKNSVEDREALNVKFNNVVVLGTLTGGDFQTTIFKMLDQRIITGVDGEQSLFVDNLAIGSRTIPANTLKAGSIIDIEIRGTAKNELAGSIALDLKFNIGGNVIIDMPSVEFVPVVGDRAFICKAKLLVRSDVLISGYFDWNIPNRSPNISISSKTLNLLNPIDFTQDNNVNVTCDIVAGDATTNITSNYGTITIE